jgi:hypothetical protein
MILGPAGINLGSGMTGGLAYILEDALSKDGYHPEFVRPANIERAEEEWLRMVLREHLQLTESPLAERLLGDPAPLSLVRLEPVHLPCSIEQTWAAILSRFEERKSALHSFTGKLPSAQLAAAEESAHAKSSAAASGS